MKTDKEYSDTIKREVEVDVDALLAAINEISESEVHRAEDNSDRVVVNGRDYHTYRELAEAFELDIHDFRSEEHTSELQSREKIVCRLLLEKKIVRTTIVMIIFSVSYALFDSYKSNVN